jgi:hypothetical protein
VVAISERFGGITIAFPARVACQNGFSWRRVKTLKIISRIFAKTLLALVLIEMLRCEFLD